MTRREVMIKTEDGRTVCDRCVVAENPLARLRGLLGCRELAIGEGLLLRRAPSIHTAFMRFPIDGIFLDEEGRVLKVAADMSPWRVAGHQRARTVIELPAGEARRRGVTPGDMLAFEPVACGSQYSEDSHV